ncbi:MAG: ABC transporter permease [Actinomycetota bacterium]|nr:ABC transporter permease [Actinomycetota bacterium]
MFYLNYMFSELRRRKGRTLLTALGLAVGIGLVVTVNSLSTGLDRAQAQVLKPLTGVGTDLSVTRPISIKRSSSSSGGPAQLSTKERKQLQKENGGSSFGLQNLGKAGTHFSRDSFLATSQLSFPASEVKNILQKESNVKSAAGGLTLSSVHISGKVPKNAGQGGGFGAPGGGGQANPNSIKINQISVGGVDQSHAALGAITSGQITKGRYFSAGSAREAILNVAYAKRKSIGVGDKITMGGKVFKVVGLASTPLGGQASDVYVKLGQLQKMSTRVGRVNTVYVRVNDASNVTEVAASIRSGFSGSSVTTAKDLAARVSGSLVDAKNLTSKLGTALELVALLAAVLIASLLTLASVTKRIRELGTLKALGWSQKLVVRQVTGESLLQGLLGGSLGVLIGVGGAALIGALGITLKATVAAAANAGAGPFGQGSVSTGSTALTLTAPVSIGLILAAVGLAVAGGLVSGAVGGLRAARLRPADSLRHLD